jgi:hypothetical protein
MGPARVEGVAIGDSVIVEDSDIVPALPVHSMSLDIRIIFCLWDTAGFEGGGVVGVRVDIHKVGEAGRCRQSNLGGRNEEVEETAESEAPSYSVDLRVEGRCGIMDAHARMPARPCPTQETLGRGIFSSLSPQGRTGEDREG